jgi:hypothetical protein
MPRIYTTGLRNWRLQKIFVISEQRTWMLTTTARRTQKKRFLVFFFVAALLHSFWLRLALIAPLGLVLLGLGFVLQLVGAVLN